MLLGVDLFYIRFYFLFSSLKLSASVDICPLNALSYFPFTNVQEKTTLHTCQKKDLIPVIEKREAPMQECLS